MAIYGYIALIVMVLGGLGYAAHSLKESGRAEVRLEWNAANAKAIEEAEAQRQRQEDTSRRTAAALEGRLAKQKEVSRDLLATVDAHIKSANSARPANCPEPRLSDELFKDWNRAGAGAESAASGIVPPEVRTSPPAAPKPADGRPR